MSDVIYELVHAALAADSLALCDDPALVHAAVAMKVPDSVCNFDVEAENDACNESFKITPPEITAILLLSKQAIKKVSEVEYEAGPLRLKIEDSVCVKTKAAFQGAVSRAIETTGTYWACDGLINQYKAFANNDAVVW